MLTTQLNLISIRVSWACDGVSLLLLIVRLIQISQRYLMKYGSYIRMTSHEHLGVSDHLYMYCLLNSLVRSIITITKLSKLRITGPLRGDPPVTDGYPSQSTRNAFSCLDVTWNEINLSFQGPICCLPVCYRTTPERPVMQALMDIDDPGEYNFNVGRGWVITSTANYGMNLIIHVWISPVINLKINIYINNQL